MAYNRRNYNYPNRGGAPASKEPVQIGSYGKLPRDLYKRLTSRGTIAVKASNLNKNSLENLGYYRDTMEFFIHTFHTTVSVKIGQGGSVMVAATRDGKFIDEKHRFTLGPEIPVSEGDFIPSLPTPLQLKNCEEMKPAGLPDMSVEATVKAWLAEVSVGEDPALSKENAELKKQLADLAAQVAMITGGQAPQTAAPAPVPPQTAAPSEFPSEFSGDLPPQAAPAAAPVTAPSPAVDEFQAAPKSESGTGPSAAEFSKFAGNI
jgi:hypothetical protein